MTSDPILTRCRIVTGEEIIDGTVVIRNGTIHEINNSYTRVPAAEDLAGDYLLPGLIELHTDNLEKHCQPRPGVMWPSPLASIIAHDTQIIGAGITTVLDALYVGDFMDGGIRRGLLKHSMQALEQARQRGYLKADHRLHLRCEVSDPAVWELFEPISGHPLLQLVSVMDHTPGQRQWTNLKKYRTYHRDKQWTDAEFQRIIAQRKAQQQRHAAVHHQRIVGLAHQRGLPIASHDDTTAAHTAQAAADGITIAEFPTTLEAATAARQSGMTIIMGAPNMVRGSSHSGNVCAETLARANLLDGLSSDYFPASLLHGAFTVHHQTHCPLPQAVALVTRNIAHALHLTDRGEITPGRRADLVRVTMDEELPVIRAVWRKGQRMA